MWQKLIVYDLVAKKIQTNTIFTAAQICDELLGVNLSNVYDNSTTRKLAWAELKIPR